MKAIEEISFFMKEHASGYLAWDKKILDAYILYFMDHGFMRVILEAGSIVGVGIARSLDLSDLENQAKDRYHFSTPGNVLFVDEIIVARKNVIPILWDKMVEIWGARKFFAGKRHGKIRIWKFNTYQNKIRILERS